MRELGTKASCNTLEKPLARLREALPNVGANKLRIAVALLHDIGITRRTRRGGMKLIDSDDDKAAAKLDDASREYAARAKRDRAVLEHMIGYVQSAQCRWRTLLDYFARDMDDARASESLSTSGARYGMPHDELDGKTCGTCDNCLHPPAVIESPRERREQARAEEEAKPERTARSFEPGERVHVCRYGEGIVEMVSGERVAVRFPDDATRTFVVEYVRRVSEAPFATLAR